MLTDDKDKQVLAAHETNKQRKSKTNTAIVNAIKALQLDNKKITIASVAKKSGVHRNTVSKNKHLLSEKDAQYGVHQDISPEGEPFYRNPIKAVKVSSGETVTLVCSCSDSVSGVDVLEINLFIFIKNLVIKILQMFRDDSNDEIGRRFDYFIVQEVLKCVSELDKYNILKKNVSQKTSLYIHEFERFWNRGLKPNGTKSIDSG